MEVEEVVLGPAEDIVIRYPCVQVDNKLTEQEIKYFSSRFGTNLNEEIPFYCKDNGTLRYVSQIKFDITTILMLKRVFGLTLTLYKSETDVKELRVDDVRLLENLIRL